MTRASTAITAATAPASRERASGDNIEPRDDVDSGGDSDDSGDTTGGDANADADDDDADVAAVSGEPIGVPPPTLPRV